ncbi:MAG: GNAT family N-acetyltransferase [Ilumatobacteraceae bacterium]
MFDDLTTGRELMVFFPLRSDHVSAALFHGIAAGVEAHAAKYVVDASHTRFRSDARHPGPGEPASGEAAWLESRGYEAAHWSAALVRPHLDDVPARELPPGVELRPATHEQLRTIMAAHLEAFRGEWDFVEPNEAAYAWVLDDPYCDPTLWQVAWADDEVVGQVKPFINHDENEERGYQRGYTEYISTHHDWRNRGIAGALLARSLLALRERGMTSAALGVDTNNPGGAFHLYRSLGFELQAYLAVYVKPFQT